MSWHFSRGVCTKSDQVRAWKTRKKGHMMSVSSAKSLTIYTDSDFIETPSSIHNFFSLVAENCQLLKTLAWVPLRDASSVPDPDQTADKDIILDVLKPLLKTPGLAMMDLVHQYPLALTQIDIELLASSWPSLETLILNIEPVFLARSNLSLKALLPFAKHCPKIIHIGLFLDATSVDESFNHSINSISSVSKTSKDCQWAFLSSSILAWLYLSVV